MSEDPNRTLLERRAEALARARAEPISDARSYALFERAGETHAIEMRYVVEVARVPEPTPLPLAAAHWLGLTSLHGELLAVAELGPLLTEGSGPGAASSGVDPLLVLVLGTERAEFALAIDLLRDLGRREEPQRQVGGSSTSALVVGALSDGARVLDGAALLADPRLTIALHHPTHA